MLASLLRFLQDLLDNLLFFNQESTDNAVLDTGSAARATIGTADGFLGAGDLGVFTGAESGNLKAFKLTIVFKATMQKILFPSSPLFLFHLGHRAHNKQSPFLKSIDRFKKGNALTPGSLAPQSPHFGAVPLFLI